MVTGGDSQSKQVSVKLEKHVAALWDRSPGRPCCFLEDCTAAGSKASAAQHDTCYILRRLCATHLLEEGDAMRTVHALSGHRDISTMILYAHVFNRGGRVVRISADRLGCDRGMR